MGPDVLLKVGQLSELALADLTPVRLDAQVDPGVLGEVGAVGKSFVTRCTLVWLRLSHMNLSVELEVGFAGENLKRRSLKQSILMICIFH